MLFWALNCIWAKLSPVRPVTVSGCWSVWVGMANISTRPLLIYNLSWAGVDESRNRQSFMFTGNDSGQKQSGSRRNDPKKWATSDKVSLLPTIDGSSTLNSPLPLFRVEMSPTNLHELWFWFLAWWVAVWQFDIGQNSEVSGCWDLWSTSLLLWWKQLSVYVARLLRSSTLWGSSLVANRLFMWSERECKKLPWSSSFVRTVAILYSRACLGTKFFPCLRLRRCFTASAYWRGWSKMRYNSSKNMKS